MDPAPNQDSMCRSSILPPSLHRVADVIEPHRERLTVSFRDARAGEKSPEFLPRVNTP